MSLPLVATVIPQSRLSSFVEKGKARAKQTVLHHPVRVVYTPLCYRTDGVRERNFMQMRRRGTKTTKCTRRKRRRRRTRTTRCLSSRPAENHQPNKKEFSLRPWTGRRGAAKQTCREVAKLAEKKPQREVLMDFHREPLGSTGKEGRGKDGSTSNRQNLHEGKHSHADPRRERRIG